MNSLGHPEKHKNNRIIMDALHMRKHKEPLAERITQSDITKQPITPETMKPEKRKHEKPERQKRPEKPHKRDLIRYPLADAEPKQDELVEIIKEKMQRKPVFAEDTGWLKSLAIILTPFLFAGKL